MDTTTSLNNMNEPIYGTFHDAATGETITRELTADERAMLPNGEPLPEPPPEQE